MLIETQEPALRLDLPRTPGYTGIILLLEIGVTRRTLQPGVPVSRENIDDRLTDNWLLLRGSRTYPDVLLLVVLQNNPWIRGNNAVSTTLGRSRLRDQANHSTARMRNARGRP